MRKYEILTTKMRKIILEAKSEDEAIKIASKQFEWLEWMVMCSSHGE